MNGMNENKDALRLLRTRYPNQVAVPVGEAARALGLSLSTIRNMIATNSVPSVEIVTGMVADGSKTRKRLIDLTSRPEDA